MKIFRLVLLTIAALVLAAAITGFFVLSHVSRRSLPDYNEDIALEGLHAPVEVFRDTWAVPHVYASDEHDLYMAVGYLLAEDRLWQMDLLRRITQGRLSEIFGSDYVDTDLLLRSLRFGEKSQKILDAADPAVLEALESFSEGVNQYIMNSEKKLPPEFGLLRYKPELWKPLYSLNLIGYMAWDLESGWTEILLSTIRGEIDSLRYAQLFPGDYDSTDVVYPYQKNAGMSVLPEMLLNNAGLSRLNADIFEGSNNWAVSGAKSATGMPLLANDMHLGLSIPGIWYQMHQHIDGKLNVSGVILAGSPVIICGHNDSIAWGMTNTTVDNVDFYEERINPDNPLQYEYMGEWKDMEVSSETIKISDGTSQEKKIMYTWRGPIVSDFANLNKAGVSMHWAGDEMSNEMRSCYLLDRASDWNEFTSALSTFASVSQNVAYADVKGNIGLFSASGIPVRNWKGAAELLPGWTDEFNWHGMVPSGELPFIYNPSSGYVASANNHTAPAGYPYHIGTWYALPSRYERITEMLTSKQQLSVGDFISIQLDRHSKYAERLMPSILNALGHFNVSSDAEKASLDYLMNWDFDMTADNPAALVFEATYRHIMESVFKDEIGDSTYNVFGGSNVSNIDMYFLMARDTSPWFDNVNTPPVETKDDIIIEGFRNAVRSITDILGENPSGWEWGKMHKITLEHPLSTVKVLDFLFHLNRGPFNVGGSFHTVSPFSYDYVDGYYVSDHGSSQRHIYDLSNWDNSLTVIPTGNSGIPASRHYCDQTSLYMQGKYHAENFSRPRVEESAVYHMNFTVK